MSFYKLKEFKPKPIRTFLVLFVIIVILVWLKYIARTYRERIKINDSGKPKYYGRQVVNPYPSDSIMSMFYTTPIVDEYNNPIHVCPVGCRLYTSATPSNSPDVFPIPTTYPECGDTRSLFSFTGNLNPDAKKIVKSYNPSIPSSIADWKLYEGDTGRYICPKEQDYYKWPYDEICKDKMDECVSQDTYGIATPSDILQLNHPTASPAVPINIRGNEFKSKLDGLCTDHYSKYGTCEVYDNTNISFNDTSDSDGITKQINVSCGMKDTSQGWSTCPFEPTTTYIPELGNEIERQPIKIWKHIYDGIAGVTPRKLSLPEKVSWQSTEMYEIVDQNYMIDK